MLYELLAQRPPYQRGSGEATVEGVRAGPPVPLAELAPDAPAELRAIAAKAMAREPGDRYASAAGLAEELRRFQTGQLVSVHRYTLAELVRRWVRRHRAAVIVGALALSALVAVGFYSLVQVVRARNAARASEAVTAERARAEEEENGRQAFLDGRPLESLALLTDANADADAQNPSPADRFLLARAESQVLPVERALPLAMDEHEGAQINTVAFAPDGSRLLVGTFAFARLLDATTGATLVTYARRGDHDELWNALMTPDGQRVAVNDGVNEYAGRIRLFDAQSGALLWTVRDTLLFAFSADGQHLLTSDGGNQVHVRDTATGAVLSTLEAPDFVESAAFSPDETRIATTVDPGSARIWDARTGKVLVDLSADFGRMFMVHFSPDGTRLVTAGHDGEGHVWDATTGRPLVTLAGHAGAIHDVAFSPDGRLIATAGYDKTVRLWDANDGALLAVGRGHRDLLMSVAFSPDGRTLVSGGIDQQAILWDLTGVAPVHAWAAANGAFGAMALSPDGTHLAIGGQAVTIVNLSTGASTAVAGPGSDVTSLAFTPDGTRLAVGCFNLQKTELVDATTGLVSTTVDGVLSSRGQPFSPAGDGDRDGDGGRFITVAQQKTAVVRNARTGAALLSVDAGFFDNASFSPDGQRLITAGLDGAVSVFDSRTGSSLLSIQVSTLSVGAAIFNPNGTTFATASYDSTAAVWDATTGQLRKRMEGHTEFLTDLAFSPDGELLATASNDYTARIWDVASGNLLEVLSGHGSVVRQVAFSPDGGTLFTGAWDDQVRSWNVGLETRSAADIAAAVTSRVPFTFDRGELVPRSP
jgi:WD40 repeat protein